jgi:subtilisin family serine protease
MYVVQYGGKSGKKHVLKESDGLIAVRTASRRSAIGAPQEAELLTRESRAILGAFELVERFPLAGVEIYRPAEHRRRRGLRNQARATLKRDKAIAFAGRVLVDPVAEEPVLYTENCFLKFEDDVRPRHIKQLLAKHKLTAKRALGYARNAWFVAAREGIGLDLFDLVARLIRDDAVELAHPELIRRLAFKGASPNQWHLRRTRIGGIDIDAHAAVEEAWSLADGGGTTIAVIDDGVDIDHEEFRAGGKIVAPRDVTLASGNPRPGSRDRHGTACAGVACADGNFGAAGVAPRARLIPIRFASGLGSQQEADAFVWAARNGADVISCSWGPPDGDWSDPNDPLHNRVVPLPDSTRLAIDFAVREGRGGKGCVICFAAGNGNESVDNDGYASYPKVMAIAACNDRGKRSAYSDFGNAVWCAFPSNDVVAPRATPGIWTTDNSGTPGYNPGQTSRGDAAGNYTNSFGGTSSAAPGAAGVAALILSRNPNLRWDEVREIMKSSCDRIDTAGGGYDANGHSAKYGYGRLNAARAVTAAVPTVTTADRIVTATATQDVAILDLRTAELALEVAESARLKSIKVSVDIEHTYIGDLVVSIRPPAATGLGAIVMHDRSGGGTDNLRRSYDAVSTPRLASLKGQSARGSWRLIVRDTARLDQGRIRSVTLEMTV